MPNLVTNSVIDTLLDADTLAAARIALGLEIGVDVKAQGSAPEAHSHAISDVTGLQAAIDGKADSVHSHAISDVTGLQAALDGAGGGDPASETVAGIVEFATQAEVDAAIGTTGEQVMRAKHNRTMWTTGTTYDSIRVGDLGGNALGEGAINIQTGRSAITEIASGVKSVAIGYDAAAMGASSVAIGNGASVSSFTTGGVAIGEDTTLDSTAAGYGVAIGYSNNVIGKNNIVIGSFGDLGSGDENNVAIGMALYNVAQWTDYNVVVGNSSGCGGGYNTILGANSNGDDYCVCVGRSTGSAIYDDFVSIGYDADAATDSVVIGSRATISGDCSVCIGYDADAGDEGLAIGYMAAASGTNCGAIGGNVQCTRDRIMEIGVWTDTSTRKGAIRIDGGNITGQQMVSISLMSNSAPGTDGGASLGSEAADTIPREMYCVRRNGDALYMDINVAGTIKTLSLGTAS